MGRKLLAKKEGQAKKRKVAVKPKHQEEPGHAIAYLKSIQKSEKMSSHQKKRALKRKLKNEAKAKKALKNSDSKSSPNVKKQNGKVDKLSAEEDRKLKKKLVESVDFEDDDDDDAEDSDSASNEEDEEEENGFDEEENSDDEADSNVLDEDDFLPADNFDDDDNVPKQKKLKKSLHKDSEDEEEDQGAMLNLPPGMADSDSEEDDKAAETAAQLKKKRPLAQLISLPNGELLRPPISMYMDEDDEDEDAQTGTTAASVEEQIHVLMKIFISGDKKGILSRKDARDQLVDLLCARYSYCTFLMNKFIDLFPKDLLEFIEANETDRPLTIRTNTLKTRRKDLMQALTKRGMNLSLSGLAWSRVGIVVDASNVPHGATPEYLAGHYAVQGASSFLPVMALDPQPEERILDLCAAPGMKTTFIGQLMKNSGVLVANDVHEERCKAIVGNLHRMGISNAVVTCLNGEEFYRTLHDFDRVLVDAPCSGTGIIAKDPSVKTSRGDPKDIEKSVCQQKRLLKTAIQCCKVGGTIVYSTCSLLIEENEHVVNYALKKGWVDVEDLSFLPGDEGFVNFKGLHFDPRIKKARRIYPHRHNMDGFFLIKFKKISK